MTFALEGEQLSHRAPLQTREVCGNWEMNHSVLKHIVISYLHIVERNIRRVLIATRLPGTLEQNFPVPLQFLGSAASTQESPRDTDPGLTGSEDSPSVPEPEGSQRDDELVKQEMLVQYLQDAYSFSQKITEAIGVISKMMYENTTTGRPVLFRNSPARSPLLLG